MNEKTGAVLPGDKVTAVNSKGLRLEKEIRSLSLIGQSNCPEFKGIKTQCSITRIVENDKVTALNSKGLRHRASHFFGLCKKTK